MAVSRPFRLGRSRMAGRVDGGGAKMSSQDVKNVQNTTRQDGNVVLECGAMDPLLRTYLMDERRLLIGRVRNIERLLGLESEEAKLRREVERLKALLPTQTRAS